MGTPHPYLMSRENKRDFWYGQDGFSDFPKVYPPSKLFQNDTFDRTLAHQKIAELVLANPDKIEIIGFDIKSLIHYYLV